MWQDDSPLDPLMLDSKSYTCGRKINDFRLRWNRCSVGRTDTVKHLHSLEGILYTWRS